MKRTPYLRVAALAILLLGGTTARADLIQWGYQWQAFPTKVTAGSGWVNLMPESFKTAKGDSDIVAVNLKTTSNASVGAPDTFTASGGKYALVITLTDTNTNTSGFLLFHGQLQGSFYKDGSNITNTIFSPSSQSIGLGGNYYTVTLGSYSPPGPSNETSLGSIGASVKVQSINKLVPEPSTMALATLGFGLGGLAAWRRRRRRR
jgi:hypothetical protein